MLIRLWWKEWRALAPIAATLWLAAAGLHWFLLSYGGAGLRNGDLVPVALGWAVIYALVAASASFAGERENRTLGFLDALPVGRDWLWLGKASFALASSLVLALLLRGVGGVGWSDLAPRTYPPGEIELFFAVLLVESIGWGLFWSAAVTSPITAGILAVLTTGLFGWVNSEWQRREGRIDLIHLDRELLIARGCAVVVALVASWLIASGKLARVAQIRPRARPVVVARSRPGRWRRVAQARVPFPDLKPLLPTPAFWSVAWQTARDGRVAWYQAAALGVLPPLLIDDAQGAQGFLVILGLAALLFQGANVFGLENSARTRPFLDHLAVPAGTVWAAKLFAGLAGVLTYGLVVLVALRWIGTGPRPYAPSDPRAFFVIAGAAANAFAVGTLGGMVFRRRITGALVAFLACFLIILPQTSLVAEDMIPGWAVLVPPVALLAITRLWAGDWLADRGGVARWARLAGLVVVPLASCLAAYTAGRAWSVPDIGRQDRDIAATAAGTTADAARYAAASKSVVAVGPPSARSAEGLQDWASVPPATREYWQQNRPVLELVRSIAAEPGTVTFPVIPLAAAPLPRPTPAAEAVGTLGDLLQLDALERRSRGDRAGSWDDILLQLRLSNHFAGGANSLEDYQAALSLTHEAVAEAIRWASAGDLSVDAVRAARKSLAEVAAVPSPQGMLRHESYRVERFLDLPTERVVDWLVPAKQADDSMVAWQRIFETWIVAPGWERTRARRILRLVADVSIANADRDRPHRAFLRSYWVRNDARPWDGSTLRTPLVDRLMDRLEGRTSFDREATDRAALSLFLAVRTWQLTHDGHAPGSLDDLVPGELEYVPVDPLSPVGDVFHYGLVEDQPLAFLAGGQTVRSRGAATVHDKPRPESPPRSWIYSVGEDGRDGGGQPPGVLGGEPQVNHWSSDDLVYLLP